MKLDYIMKLGGSILTDLDKTRILLSKIQNSPNKNVAYTVGSGYLGEVYKKWIKVNNSSDLKDNDMLNISRRNR